jgi:hypothetical protein
MSLKISVVTCIEFWVSKVEKYLRGIMKCNSTGTIATYCKNNDGLPIAFRNLILYFGRMEEGLKEELKLNLKMNKKNQITPVDNIQSLNIINNPIKWENNKLNGDK